MGPMDELKRLRRRVAFLERNVEASSHFPGPVTQNGGDPVASGNGWVVQDSNSPQESDTQSEFQNYGVTLSYSTSAGFPGNSLGPVVMFRASNENALQAYFDRVADVLYVRSAAAGDAWNPWHEVALSGGSWQSLTLQSGYSPHSKGRTPGYIVAGGVVYLRGRIRKNSGVYKENDVPVKLPSSIVPSSGNTYVVGYSPAGSADAFIDSSTNEVVMAHDISSDGFGLDSISWRLD